MDPQPSIDRLTVLGLALILMPLTTMAHEIGGHAATCVATGGRLVELGAFYVNCDSPDLTARRLVALAGAGFDGLLGLIFWRLRSRVSGDLARLVVWYCWLCFSFSAAGYFLFSGLSGIGDLGPGENGGIGPLPQPLIWRAIFAIAGGYTYWRLTKAGMLGLDAMIGQGMQTRSVRRTAAHLFYLALCLAALVASLPNPVGLFVTLASAVAASFGGKAGLISIGFATQPAGQPRQFVIARNWVIVALGIAISLAFSLVLGPTLRPGA